MGMAYGWCWRDEQFCLITWRSRNVGWGQVISMAMSQEKQETPTRSGWRLDCGGFRCTNESQCRLREKLQGAEEWEKCRSPHNKDEKGPGLYRCGRTWGVPGIMMACFFSSTACVDRKRRKIPGTAEPTPFLKSPWSLGPCWLFAEWKRPKLFPRGSPYRHTQRALLVFPLKTRFTLDFLFHDKSKASPRNGVEVLSFRVESSETLILANFSGDRTKQNRQLANINTAEGPMVQGKLCCQTSGNCFQEMKESCAALYCSASLPSLLKEARSEAGGGMERKMSERNSHSNCTQIYGAPTMCYAWPRA